MRVEHRQLLMAMHDIEGIVDIERHRGGRLVVAGAIHSAEVGLDTQSVNKITPLCYIRQRIPAMRVEVEEGRGFRLRRSRFPSPLIERSVRISRTALSDWFHPRTTVPRHGGRGLSRSTPSAPYTAAYVKRRVPCVGTL